jgi:chemotaxis signal transduction protein
MWWRAMSTMNDELNYQAQDLKDTFDRSFAEPHREAKPEVERFLSIRIGDDPYAVRLNEIAGIVSNRKIIPLPTPLSHLLGLAGNRGVVLPIYDLAALIGYDANAFVQSKWIVICRGDNPIGLTRLELEGYLELPRSEIRSPEQGSTKKITGRSAFVRQTIPPARGVIEIAAVLEAITNEALATIVGHPSTSSSPRTEK